MASRNRSCADNRDPITLGIYLHVLQACEDAGIAVNRRDASSSVVNMVVTAAGNREPTPWRENKCSGWPATAKSK